MGLYLVGNRGRIFLIWVRVGFKSGRRWVLMGLGGFIFGWESRSYIFYFGFVLGLSQDGDGFRWV